MRVNCINGGLVPLLGSTALYSLSLCPSIPPSFRVKSEQIRLHSTVNYFSAVRFEIHPKKKKTKMANLSATGGFGAIDDGPTWLQTSLISSLFRVFRLLASDAILVS